MQMSTEHVDKITDSLQKAYSDINIMMRDSMNAALQSTTIFTKGCEDLCDSMNALIQKSLDNGAAASRALVNVKNMHDLVDVQSSLVRGSFDSIMNEANRMMQMSSRIAQECVEPVTQNMNATIIKFSKNRAA